MAKIHTLKINNFRGIESFEQVFGISNFVCLIGRGDSGKTTILDSISYVLSPNWNLTIKDTDFYNCDISKPIEIEVSLYDLPKKLIQESKFGLYIRGLNRIDDIISDEIEDDLEIILTLKLVVGENLEPKWFIINSRQDPIEISSSQRGELNMFQVSDYIDNHFSWDKRSPLKALFKLDDEESSISDVLTHSMRNVKKEVDKKEFKEFDNVLTKIVASSKNFGIDISNVSTSLDLKNISLSDSRFSLYDNNVPFRLKGKGSKRLISIAIQAELAKSGGIVLIDEIEQGLEPDRAQHLAKTLKTNNAGQIFITTHSRDVLVELGAENLFIVKKNESKLRKLDSSLNGTIRNNPEAFFAEKVIICEGATEIGFCRALNENRLKEGNDSIALKGLRLVDGHGAGFINYCEAFIKCGYRVCVFCDSDDKVINNKKDALIKLGIEIIDCENDNSLENQLFKDICWSAVKELVLYAVEEKDLKSIQNSVSAVYKKNYKEKEYSWITVDSIEMRNVLGEVSKKKGWFKRIDHGEKIGEIYHKYSQESILPYLNKQVDKLSNWIDNA
ncbi:ATP-binding protein [Polaribacter undariae]|uniref:ATP-binding protein n=1 Tax=Polaribacter sejongensis TaxID=985043 RepID=A0AAJ1QY05_9FLAO|nr:ATP-binding protein [Polaribacter undariae]MDN3620197.1 ATP-binding protein [Polaribacter undariae]UWD32598.1 ATP-binding protein [Polaribacter undariae]